MRKIVKFDRKVRLMIPVWHQPEIQSSSKYKTKYSRPMTTLELVPDKEYKCSDLQALLDKGALFASEADHTYVCSCGFIPIVDNLPTISPVTSGLDPVEELN